MKFKLKKQKSSSINILEIVAIAILIGYMFFMRDDNRIVTYSYLFFEIVSIIILLFRSSFKVKINQYMLFVLALELYIFALTFMNKSLSYSYLCMLAGEISLTFFIVSKIKKAPGRLIASFEAALLLLYIFDIISVFYCLITGIHTNDNFGLAGHKNYHSFLFILTIGFKLLSNKINRKTVLDTKVLVLAVLSIIVEFAVGSASGAVSVVLLVLLCYLMKKKSFPFLNLELVLIALMVLNYILIFALSKSGVMVTILSYLGRDAGLTGRTAIWNEALKLIQAKLYTGYGFYKEVFVYFTDRGWIYNHCHNFFLNLVLSGGIFYAMAIIFFLFYTARKIKECSGEIANLFTYIIGCYLLLGVSEIIINVNTMFFPLLTFGVYSKYLVGNMYPNRTLQ